MMLKFMKTLRPDVWFMNRALTISHRRENNPEREIRRQQELERMRVTQPIYRNKTRYSETYIAHN